MPPRSETWASDAGVPRFLHPILKKDLRRRAADRIVFPAFAGLAQLVARNLAKVEVAGSNPVARSMHSRRLQTLTDALRGVLFSAVCTSSELCVRESALLGNCGVWRPGNGSSRHLARRAAGTAPWNGDHSAPASGKPRFSAPRCVPGGPAPGPSRRDACFPGRELGRLPRSAESRNRGGWRPQNGASRKIAGFVRAPQGGEKILGLRPKFSLAFVP